MKICRLCKIDKINEDFYKGHATCKECYKNKVKKYQKDNSEKIQIYELKRANLPHRVEARINYTKTEQGKEARKRAHKKYIENNVIKRAAHILVGNYIRDGKIIKSDN